MMPNVLQILALIIGMILLSAWIFIVLFSFVKKNYWLGKGSIKRWMIVDLKDSTHDTLKTA